MNRYLLIMGNATLALLWTLYAIVVAICIVGCKSPKPAPVEPVTEQPREPRPTPVAPPGTSVPYTNSQQDALVEYSGSARPPALPGKGPIPVYKSPPAISNWLTKAIGVQPKPMTNQIPGSTILTKITTTDDQGKQFTAELELNGNQTIRAGAKMAVVIFALAHTNYSVQVCTNLTDGRWTDFSSGVSRDTNGAVVIVDLHEGTSPLKFYRQVETK